MCIQKKIFEIWEIQEVSRKRKKIIVIQFYVRVRDLKEEENLKGMALFMVIQSRVENFRNSRKNTCRRNFNIHNSNVQFN